MDNEFSEKALQEIMTSKEAADRWGLGATTVRQACTGYAKAAAKFTASEARKSAGTWLVTHAGMKRVFGLEPKQ